MNSEGLVQIVARHEKLCLELKEAFNVKCIETAGVVFSCAGRGRPRKTGQAAERAVTGFSKIRNEALAKALNYTRLMEEWGCGLKRGNDVRKTCGR